MRILPIALYLHYTMGPDYPHRAKAYQIIHKISSLTHAHPISLIACGIYCAAANDLLCGKPDIQEGIALAKLYYRSKPDMTPCLSKFERVDSAVLESLSRSEVSSSGYVVHTLEAALWCLMHSADYRACLLKAVNLGDDTDTVGAVVGGLAGIRYGVAGIPKEWLAVIARRTEIETLCNTFAASIS